MNIVKSTIRIAGVALAMLAAGNLCAADASICPPGWIPGPDANWKVYWDDALVEARLTGKKLFVLATSDECGWCVRLREDVLLTAAFREYAKKNLVLLCLDSPGELKRSGKALPVDQKQHNDAICSVLGLGCCIPCAAVADADSRRYGSVAGYVKTPKEYIANIEMVLAKDGKMPKGGVRPKIFTEGYGGEAAVASTDDEGSEDCCDVTWYYETFTRKGQTCARIISGKNKYAGDLTIPSSLDGFPVAEIGRRAFYRCTELRSVKIPLGVTKIGKSAFARCSALELVNIAASVTDIGDYAFEHCCGIRSMAIPSGVSNIGYHAFADCSRGGTVYVTGGAASQVSARLSKSGLGVNKLRFVEVNR